MRTTLNLDEDVVTAARDLAAERRQSIGAVVSDLARRGLAPAQIESEGDLPVIRVPAGTPPITAAMVRKALDDD